MAKKSWKKPEKKALEKSYENRGKYGNDRKGYIDPDISVFVPEEGENCVRVLPLHPDEKGTESYGLDVYSHWSVGANEGSYLCPTKMKGNRCPICERQKDLWEDDPEAAKKLYPGQRVLMWVIDRNNEKEGPKLWLCPKSVNDDIIGVSYKKKTQEIIDVSDPDEGYDIYFDRIGQKLLTKYKNFQLDDDSNELDDDLIDEISPFCDVLISADYDEIYAAYYGTPTEDPESDDDEEDDDIPEPEDLKGHKKRRKKKVVEEEEDEDDDVLECFGDFDSDSDDCDDCDDRKKCRKESKSRKEDKDDGDEEETKPSKKEELKKRLRAKMKKNQ